jgi:TatD DNase family protein
LVLAHKYNLDCTAGVHPSSTGELEDYEAGADRYIEELIEVIEQDRGAGGGKKIKAIGEIGLGKPPSRLSFRNIDSSRL